jgi:hypothetical protein
MLPPLPHLPREHALLHVQPSVPLTQNAPHHEAGPLAAPTPSAAQLQTRRQQQAAAALLEPSVLLQGAQSSCSETMQQLQPCEPPAAGWPWAAQHHPGAPATLPPAAPAQAAVAPQGNSGDGGSGERTPSAACISGASISSDDSSASSSGSLPSAPRATVTLPTVSVSFPPHRVGQL